MATGRRRFPVLPLVCAGALIGIALIGAVGARLGGGPTTRQQPPAPTASQRLLHFEDRPDGSVAVYVSETQHPVHVLAAGTNGFARGVLRSLVRERRLHGVDAESPFRLTRWADGRLSLDDPATGVQIALDAFGPTNAGAFAALLADTEKTP